MPRRVGTALALLSAALVGGQGVVGHQAERTPARAPATPLHELAFQFGTGQPIIPLRLDGGPPMPFVVDTGASIHLIDARVARAATAAGTATGRLSGGGQAAADVRWLDGLTMASGSASWTGQRAALADLGYPERRHFAGLLGAPILMRYAPQFAFAEQRLRLYDAATYTPPPGARLVPFELQDDLPVIRVSIDAGTGPLDARLMVDTGASTTIDLNRPFVDAHGLVAAVPDAAAADRPAALGGTAPFLYGTARRVTLAGEVFDRPRIGLSRATSGSSARATRDGIIGTALLRRFVMTVDYRRRQLVLQPASPAAAPAAPPR